MHHSLVQKLFHNRDFDAFVAFGAFGSFSVFVAFGAFGTFGALVDFGVIGAGVGGVTDLQDRVLRSLCKQ